MDDEKPIQEPSPTIVGPQPTGRDEGENMSVPRGLEQLVAMASLNEEWKAKVLENPVQAAKEAGVELSESERKIAASVPRQALEGMIGSFAKLAGPKPYSVAKTAAYTAAARQRSSSTSRARPPPSRRRWTVSPWRNGEKGGRRSRC